jgi:hypothetical protein
MVPASLYLGFTASIIWVAQVKDLRISKTVLFTISFQLTYCYFVLQGTYLTSAALSHAREHNLPEGPTLGSFNGEFWGVLATTQVLLYLY